MKRHIQKTGVRKFFGQDFIDLQAEPLKALDAFFAEYGQCIIQGCTITEAEGGTFDVAPGLVALESTDPESGAVAIHVMPFAGAASVALPLYLAAKWVVAERAYGDGKVKPIAYDLLALASGVAPEAPHLVLNAVGANRFVDALQDGTHRFVSDAERTKWNDILRQAKEYAAAQAATAAASAQATALGLAKAHTDTTAVAVRDELAVGDASTLVGAKQYADRIVAALIDGSPEMLNTLQELAAALGGDPNFATTVMTEIGKRVTTEAMTTAMDKKFDKSGGTISGGFGSRISAMTIGCGMDEWSNQNYVTYSYEGGQDVTHINVVGIKPNLPTLKLKGNGDMEWDGHPVLHSGNFDPASKADKTGVTEDLAKKLDKTGGTIEGGYRSFIGASTIGCGMPSWGSNVYVDFYYDSDNGIEETRIHVCGGPVNMPYLRLRANGDMIWNGQIVYHSGNIDKAKLDAMPTKIIRGSVTASGGNGGGNAYSVGVVYGESAMVRITHNLGTDNYSATASAVSNGSNIHADNAVTVWRKGLYDVDYVVTAGRGGEREMCAFDYLIIPY